MSDVREHIHTLIDSVSPDQLDSMAMLASVVYPGPTTQTSEIVQLKAIGVILDKLDDIEERLAAIEGKGVNERAGYHNPHL